jgi:broad specificity phosphatase PhoE
MRFVEIRRHSVRDLPDEHLSVRGRQLAAEVGKSRGPFHVVVSSPTIRARETALAMGFPPAVESELWYELGDGKVPWPLSFKEMGEEFRINPRAKVVAARFRAALQELLAHIPDGGAALIVAHGGVPELVGASWGDAATLERLGPACKCMEGIYLSVEGDTCVGVADLRVPQGRTRI